MIHQLVAQANTLFTAGCGYTEKTRTTEMPEDFTGWWRDVTCPLCALRVIVHKKVESMSDIPRLIDDPMYTHRPFHFTGKRFGFMWLEPTPLIYVYNKVGDPSAMQATHIKEAKPEDGYTYVMAQEAARAWIIMQGDRFNDDGSMRSTSVRKPPARREPPKPYVPPGYDGPLCAKCGKIDEGDFVPNPTNMLEEVCMTCLVKGSK